MSGRGGHRVGAGRKTGSTDGIKALRVGAGLAQARRKNTEAVVVGLDEDESPLRVLLDTMLLLRDKANELERPHGSHVYVEEDDEGKVIARHGPMALRMMACEVAKNACPYLHARLNSVTAEVRVNAFEDALLELDKA